MKKKIIPLFLAILLIGLYGLQQSFFKVPFVYLGTAEATQVTLSSRLASPVKEILVQEGTVVQKGTPLLRFLCDDIQLDYEEARRDFERAKPLHAGRIMATENFELLQMKTKKMALRKSWCEVTSPLGGTLLKQWVQEGEMASPGTKLFTLANLLDLYVYIYVEATMLSKLKVGQKVKLTISELKSEQEGEIVLIEEEAQFIPKNIQTRDERLRLVHGVKLSLKNRALTIKPGMTVEVIL